MSIVGVCRDGVPANIAGNVAASAGAPSKPTSLSVVKTPYSNHAALMSPSSDTHATVDTTTGPESPEYAPWKEGYLHPPAETRSLTRLRNGSNYGMKRLTYPRLTPANMSGMVEDGPISLTPDVRQWRQTNPTPLTPLLNNPGPETMATTHACFNAAKNSTSCPCPAPRIIQEACTEVQPGSYLPDGRHLQRERDVGMRDGMDWELRDRARAIRMNLSNAPNCSAAPCCMDDVGTEVDEHGNSTECVILSHIPAATTTPFLGLDGATHHELHSTRPQITSDAVGTRRLPRPTVEPEFLSLPSNQVQCPTLVTVEHYNNCRGNGLTQRMEVCGGPTDRDWAQSQRTTTDEGVQGYEHTPESSAATMAADAAADAKGSAQGVPTHDCTCTSGPSPSVYSGDRIWQELRKIRKEAVQDREGMCRSHNSPPRNNPLHPGVPRRKTSRPVGDSSEERFPPGDRGSGKLQARDHSLSYTRTTNQADAFPPASSVTPEGEEQHPRSTLVTHSNMTPPNKDTRKRSRREPSRQW